MIWKMNELFEHTATNSTYLDGKWVPARPINYRSVSQIVREVWLVLTGKADCIMWPGSYQDTSIDLKKNDWKQSDNIVLKINKKEIKNEKE